jgi:hypothetical protein
MTDHLDDKTYDALFGIRRSVRYHSHRRRFYEVWNTMTVVMAVAGGSSATTAMFAELPVHLNVLPVVITALIALVAAIDLAVGTTRQANHHSDLARQFIALEQRFANSQNLEAPVLEEIIKDRLSIEATEPPSLRLLDASCHFEILRSLGDTQEHPSIPLWRRTLMHFFSQAGFARTLG